jgi:hypothetical protein
MRELLLLLLLLLLMLLKCPFPPQPAFSPFTLHSVLSRVHEGLGNTDGALGHLEACSAILSQGKLSTSAVSVAGTLAILQHQAAIFTRQGSPEKACGCFQSCLPLLERVLAVARGRRQAAQQALLDAEKDSVAAAVAAAGALGAAAAAGEVAVVEAQHELAGCLFMLGGRSLQHPT